MMRNPIGRVATFGFVLALAVLIVNGAVALYSTWRVAENEGQVAHTHEVLAALEGVLATLTDAETGQRGYLLTGDERYLQPYDDALKRVADEVTHLRDLTRDNPDQQRRFPRLQEAIDRKLRELARTVELRKDAGFDAARQVVLTGEGRAAMGDIRRVVDEMEATENALLLRRQEESRSSLIQTIVALLLASLLAAALVGVAYVLVRRDLAGRARAEAVLREQREWLHVTLTSIGDAVIATDAAGRVAFLNPVAEGLTGWPQGEAAGRPLEAVFRIVNEYTRAPAENPVARVLREGVVVGLANHTVLLGRAGRETPIADSAAPIRGARGQAVGVVLVFRDVTEQKEAEAARRAHEKRLRLFVEHSPAAIAMFDRDMRYLLVSRRWLADYNLGDQDLRGRSHYDVFPELPERWKEIHRRCLAGAVERAEDDRFVRADGSVDWLRWEVRPWANDRGEVGGILIFSEVVTRRKLAEDALKEADRRKDEFLAMLSHELRNPLAALRNALHLLTMPGADAAIVGRARGVMERQVHHLVRLVDDLLDVSRIMRDKIELRKEPVDLADVVARAVEAARPVIDARGQDLTVRLPPEPVRLEADPVRLAQVVGNLLNNSAKFTAGAGRIALTAAREGEEVVVRVRDTGVGIPADLLPQVFDAFVQADRSLDRSQGGLGIGLTLVRRLVELHGGRAEAHSAGPGQGSEFVVRLPARKDEGGRRKDESEGRSDSSFLLPPSSLPRRRVLVVDDNVDAADSLALLLRLAGHDVRVAHDGPSALEAARAERPDAVFLDLGMPGMDGYEVARRLRQESGLDGVRLVALTGWGQDEDRRRTQEAGFDQHLVKPAGLAAVQAVLAEGR
jgi:PAS domain S-box-containing protein